jgi:hypothetical protein
MFDNTLSPHFTDGRALAEASDLPED